MDRRDFLKLLAALPALPAACRGSGPDSRRALSPPRRRVRPGDPGWPSETSWDGLRRRTKGALIRVESPLDVCRSDPEGPSCARVLESLRNPYYIRSEPGLTQSTGWVDAWTSSLSSCAVAAEETGDVVAAVNFARRHHLRLVVKGGAHSYQGRSNAPDSLLIWMRPMDDVRLHDAFVPRGCAGREPPRPAVTLGGGAIWAQAYDEVTTRAGRYVQGGGCMTVGVAGLIQSGGFGSFSKRYGLAASGLLEAEVVTADGSVRIANRCRNPDLFWALKGGGGGSFGVVTRLTLVTRDLPVHFGAIRGRIRAGSDAAFRDLAKLAVDFYHDRLFDPHWGEQIQLRPDDSLEISMMFQGLTAEQAEAAWRPFRERVADRPGDFSVEAPLQVAAVPARRLWDTGYLEKHFPGEVVLDDRPGSAGESFFWAANREEAGQFWNGYRSAWLPASLLEDDRRDALAEALFRASRHREVALHFNKGLAGAPEAERAAARKTAMNPLVADAFALAIVAANAPRTFPGVPGHEPDVADGRRRASAVDRAMEALLEVVPRTGSYVAESDYFRDDWQRAFWGSNYGRLAAIKRRYDPHDLFVVHHGVGSERWTDDGFTRVTPMK